MVLRSSFVFRDKKATVSIKTFFKPLALPVWIFTIVSAILLSVMLKLAFYYERSITDKPEASWSYVFFITIATFCQQGIYAMYFSTHTSYTDVHYVYTYNFTSLENIKVNIRRTGDFYGDLNSAAKLTEQ